MTRYKFVGKSSRFRIIVGFDPTLVSFFAQVEDLAFETNGAIVNEDASIGDCYEEGLIVWVGAATPITDLQDIKQAIANYGTIPLDIEERILRDQAQNKPFTQAHVPPTIMQAYARKHKRHSRHA